MALSLSDLLKRMLEMSGSDLHITTNSPPQVRVHGHLVPLDLPQMTPADTKQLAYSVMTDSQKHRFEEHLELDFSFGLKGLARFRANVFNQRGATSAVFRVIPFEIKNFNQLGLAPVVAKLCEKPRGLVLVTGPTGSGKSTTLASMIDKINSERHDHILTIEDPIEFVHMNKNCVVNQRELHADTKSFTDALRAALSSLRASSVASRVVVSSCWSCSSSARSRVRVVSVSVRRASSSPSSGWCSPAQPSA